MIIDKKGYGYRDLTIVPAPLSEISSRSECNPFIKDDKLPIFTSSMSTVVNEKNWDLWEKNHINVIIPRNIDIDTRLKFLLNKERAFNGFVAMSLSEFEKYFCDGFNPFDDKNEYKYYKIFRVCIDIANGHMKKLYDVCKKAKQIAQHKKYNVVIMVGNIANAKTYKYICQYYHNLISYVRLGIGSGANCLTTSNVAIHYPMASLIDECNKVRQELLAEEEHIDAYHSEPKYELDSLPKIIADGGIRNYSDVIKALALGADYVMIGSVFSSLLESAGDMTLETWNEHYNVSYNKEKGEILYNIDRVVNIYTSLEEDKQHLIRSMKTITKETYGMSTKKAQRLIDPNAKLKTSEGCTKYVKVTHTINQWTNNMIDYLKSAMSYTNKKDINDFIGNVDLVINSPCEIYAVNQ